MLMRFNHLFFSMVVSDKVIENSQLTITND
jgi:hypothetical protein